MESEVGKPMRGAGEAIQEKPPMNADGHGFQSSLRLLKVILTFSNRCPRTACAFGSGLPQHPCPSAFICG